MEVQEQNRHRRSVRFDAACLGFREPYKVICDDIFMFYLVGHQITPADTALANTLGGAVQLFTTRCVLEELKSPEFKRILGAFHSKTLDAASSLLTARNQAAYYISPSL
ncbi:PREDICTED: uncharacterized protein LOC109161308 [Ipomoea nil]|uniref:uncharacterized protein LOC109161308 n=1 Tax=Ipomoea nil TaxID=35883 RepID=UPI0009016D1E|nr:PREDICTED: uncharacterized protein LOC109161308 [Ipomoea nil]